MDCPACGLPVEPGDRVTVLNANGTMEFWHCICYAESLRSP